MKYNVSKYQKGGKTLWQKVKDAYNESKPYETDPMTGMNPARLAEFEFSPEGKILRQFQKGGTFEDWYKTVPINKNDTTSYNLRRAYQLAPKQELINFVNNKDAHLNSVYFNKQIGIYEFMKSKDHPTLSKELDWYNSNDKEAIKFRNNYSLDSSSNYYKYIPKHQKGVTFKDYESSGGKSLAESIVSGDFWNSAQGQQLKRVGKTIATVGTIAATTLLPGAVAKAAPYIKTVVQATKVANPIGWQLGNTALNSAGTAATLITRPDKRLVQNVKDKSYLDAAGNIAEIGLETIPMINGIRQVNKVVKIPGLNIDAPELGYHKINPEHWSLHPSEISKGTPKKEIAALYFYSAVNRAMPVLKHTPLVYPARKVAEKVMNAGSSPLRSVSDVMFSLSKPKDIPDFKGKLNTWDNNAGIGDLIKLYLYGDQTGFKEIDNTVSTIDFGSRYKKLYPDAKKYYLTANIPHNEPIRMTNTKPMRASFPKESNNPIGPLDNIAGHQAEIRNVNNKPIFITQDLWKFNPKDYSGRWSDEMNPFQRLLAEKQSGIVDKVGKPFYLVQNNPIIKNKATKGFTIPDYGLNYLDDPDLLTL